MNKHIICFISILLLFACGEKQEKIHPKKENITESVYASGYLKSKNQYQVFSKVNGLISDIFVTEGDTVKPGSPLITISDETTRLNTMNAQLAADYADYKANSGKLEELEANIELAKKKLANDSLLNERQKQLWKQEIGSKNDFEQRDLAFQNSKTAYEAALLRYIDLKKQISFNSDQSKNNLQISRKIENDYTIKSDINGKVYIINKEKGEMVNPQTPLAIIGDVSDFILEMQIDEYDVVRVKKGQKAFVTLDSYKGQLFEAIVDKIDPMMNEHSKTFLVEGVFTKKPPILYPNLTLEANIVIMIKNNVLTLPRSYVTDDGFVMKSNGDKIKVSTGLKDYDKIEILSGVSENDELIIPQK